MPIVQTLAQGLASLLASDLVESYSNPSSVKIVMPSSLRFRGALLLDPRLRFILSDKKFSPTNRIRKRLHLLSVLNAKQQAQVTDIVQQSSSLGTDLHNFPDQGTQTTSNTNVFNYVFALLPQHQDTCADTTARTRKLDEKYGELELSEFRQTTKGWKHGWCASTIDVHIDYKVRPTVETLVKTTQVEVWPSVGSLSTANLMTIRTSEKLLCDGYIRSRGFRMLADCLPTARSFDGFRELGELRDLPQTIKTSLELIPSRYWHMSLRDIANQYVNLQFGILPTIGSIEKLLKALKEIPRKLARLQDVRLTDATFHSTAQWTEGGGSSTFTMLTPQRHTLMSVGPKNSRTVQMKATVNCYVRFPDVKGPLAEFWRWVNILGLNPSVRDLYHLWPWTWCVDWFTDLGYYIDVITQFNSDESTINWGCVTCKTDLALQTNAVYRATSTSSVNVNQDVSLTTKYLYIGATHEGHLHTTVRRDASKIPNASVVASLTGLSSWQSSIIGALIASRHL